MSSARICQACPRGTYQDEPLQSSCKPCKKDHMTPAEGQTKVQSCYNTNQCETGENDCSWHAICEDLPDEVEGEPEQPRFECKCKPGFKGNGTSCQDACINFCLNGGVCKKNPVGQVECQCKEHFTGERCEARYQPKQEKVAQIAGGIGGGVGFLIIIVVVIWMICFRFNRKKSKASEAGEKSQGIGATAAGMLEAPGAGDPSEGNFIYGRPQPQPSLGYYYEDEEDFVDMKTMYINDAFDGEPGTPKAPNGESKEEMFERLKRINQHMYRPPKQVDGNDDGPSDDQEDPRTHH